MQEAAKTDYVSKYAEKMIDNADLDREAELERLKRKKDKRKEKERELEIARGHQFS